MRVITGSARGRRLGELKGMETRPTTDKVKESIFNCIQFDVEDARVLDNGTSGISFCRLYKFKEHRYPGGYNTDPR